MPRPAFVLSFRPRPATADTSEGTGREGGSAASPAGGTPATSPPAGGTPAPSLPSAGTTAPASAEDGADALRRAVGAWRGSAYALGFVLFVVTLALNFIALRVVKRFREAYE